MKRACPIGRFSWIALVGLCLAAPAAIAQNGTSQQDKARKAAQDEPWQSGILYGEHFAYAISAPKGWILDSETARAQGPGCSAVFYRRGETWQHGKAVMYIVVVAKTKGVSLQTVVQDDVAEFKKGNDHTGVKKSPSLQTKDHREAVSCTFVHAASGAAEEQVCYVDAPTAIFTIVLTARTKNDYERAVPDFAALVRSFFFITSDVKIEKKGEDHR
jgi:hypothetical protein